MEHIASFDNGVCFSGREEDARILNRLTRISHLSLGKENIAEDNYYT